MNCYECAKLGATASAVALCTHCSCGLCLEHLRAVRFEALGGMPLRCEHDTWRHVDADSFAVRR
jgi:hypothetical protein